MKNSLKEKMVFFLQLTRMLPMAKRLRNKLHEISSKNSRIEKIVNPKVNNGVSIIDYYKFRNSLTKIRRRALRAKELGAGLTNQQQELLGDILPVSVNPRVPVAARTPSKEVAFVTVANNRFIPGLEALILSILKVYPDFDCDFYVFHNGSISEFSQDRLRSFYRNIHFEVPDMSWFNTVPNESDNQKRIGKLGYMNIMALSLSAYKRTVILDSDMIVLNDISAVWNGQGNAIDEKNILICPDAGARPYAAVSPKTGRPVYNSGLISIPKRYTGNLYLDELKQITIKSMEPYCDRFDRFADQKVWNIFIHKKDVLELSINFNCNAKYIERYYGGSENFLSIIHFAGGKPWYNTEYLNEELLPRNLTRPAMPNVWRRVHNENLAKARMAQYEIHRQKEQPLSAKKKNLFGDRGCFFIGNGPSLKETGLREISEYETFVFNWFVNHDKFDDIQPNNLVLASHMLFGGWNIQNPKLPAEFIRALYSKKWKPRIWVSFYFKPYIDGINLSKEYDVRYFLFEKPFKQNVDKVGSASLRLSEYLRDGRTGVLTAALPIAVEMGFRNIGLVGCDSNYNQVSGGNYFYDQNLHRSASTRDVSLSNVWAPEGRGHYAYEVAQRELTAIGGSFFDFTIGGQLNLPKGDLESLVPKSGERAIA